MSLHSSIESAGGVYKRFAPKLQKLGINTFLDLLYHIPTRYEDFSLISKISQVQVGETVTIQGTLTDFRNIYSKGFKQLQKAVVTDPTGEIEVTWFNQPYLSKIMNVGDTVSLSGKVDTFLHKIVLQSPEYEILKVGKDAIHTGRLVPIYHETYGITSKWLRKEIYNALKRYEVLLPDFLPENIRTKYNYPTLIESLHKIHFPKEFSESQLAKERLGFDELFLIQLASLKRKHLWTNTLQSHPFEFKKYKKDIEKFWESLPFELTSAQKNALHEIFTDLGSKKPMNRLLEGDVGSGKTVVAAISMYLTYLNGFQSVLMAPTEILANQHYNTISKLLEPLGVSVGIATGSKKKFELKSKNHDKTKKINPDSSSMIHNSSQKTDILVGTHAVLNKNIEFSNLGLVVIDEQQRFGVEQRAIIKEKGTNPHLLTMTATPIPRTVALTMYGDLDLSILNEMPKGRKEIKTWLVPEIKRDNGYEWIRKQVLQGDQIFIICPFIEESESMQTIKAAKVEYEKLQKDIFPDLNLGLLHGKLKGKEKDSVLQDFKDKKYHILVATPVVEVGIDIPNATVMVIEAADRFGLAQLHQLRGRVGRGDKQSFCLLFADSPSQTTIQRLKALETSNSGPELAELDLKLRGPGDIYGTKQHGVRNLKIASFSDFPLLDKTKKESELLFPQLEKYPLLQKKVEEENVKAISAD